MTEGATPSLGIAPLKTRALSSCRLEEKPVTLDLSSAQSELGEQPGREALLFLLAEENCTSPNTKPSVLLNNRFKQQEYDLYPHVGN